jgi:hypothetical protein
MAFFDVYKFAYFSLAIFCCGNLNFIEAEEMLKSNFTNEELERIAEYYKDKSKQYKEEAERFEQMDNAKAQDLAKKCYDMSTETLNFSLKIKPLINSRKEINEKIKEDWEKLKEQLKSCRNDATCKENACKEILSLIDLYLDKDHEEYKKYKNDTQEGCGIN